MEEKRNLKKNKNLIGEDVEDETDANPNGVANYEDEPLISGSKLSPQGLRSGPKGQVVSLSAVADEIAKVQRSLSSPASSTDSSTMPADEFDPSVVEKCVMNDLPGDDVFNRLVTRLNVIMTATVKTAVKSALSEVSIETERLRVEVSGLTSRVVELEDQLEQRTDELEQYSRRTNLRIYGVEETASEATDELVVDLCQKHLGLELPVEAISRSHRVGQPLPSGADGEKRSRPLIVHFTSYRDRRRVFNAKNKLKGTSITIREDLTAQRSEVFWQAVQRYGLRRTWTNDGKVMWLRKDGTRGAATCMADLTESNKMEEERDLKKNKNPIGEDVEDETDANPNGVANYEDEPLISGSKFFEEYQKNAEAVMSVEKDDIFYNMDHKNRGLAVVFNHEDFCPELNREPRKGSALDAENLKETLEMLNFEVQVYNDLPLRKIRKVIIKAFLKSLVIMPHPVQDDDLIILRDVIAEQLVDDPKDLTVGDVDNWLVVVAEEQHPVMTEDEIIEDVLDREIGDEDQWKGKHLFRHSLQ